MPASGLALPDGRVIPAGTIVGMNQWVVTRSTKIYGDDVEVFRPERWLRGGDESEAEAEMRLKRMKDLDFTFGGGNRVCTGRHMATANLNKVTATLFSRYNVSEFELPCWISLIWNRWSFKENGNRTIGGLLSFMISRSSSRNGRRNLHSQASLRIVSLYACGVIQ